MTSKLYEDPEFGPITLNRNTGSRGLSIRVRERANRHGTRISVTIPFISSWQEGISFVGKRREWIRNALRNQAEKKEKAFRDGKALYSIGEGTVVRTLLSEIWFRPCSDITGRICIRSSAAEDYENPGRLWYSLDKPFSIKDILYPTSIPEGVNPEKQLMDALVEAVRADAKFLLPFKAEMFARQSGLHFNRLAVKHNSTNWGSCSHANNINLNLNLVRLPEPLCDYVILHELCHLKEHNHGPVFHSILEELCISNIRRLKDAGSPDVNEYSAWLDGTAETPLNERLSRELSSWRMI